MVATSGSSVSPCPYGKLSDKLTVEGLQDAETLLKTNNLTAPLFIDGTGWRFDEKRETGALRLLGALGSNRSVKSLIFQNANINELMDKAFSCAMEENSCLSSLTLRNLLSGDSNYNIPLSVLSHPHLEELKLSRISLNQEACLKLSEMIRQSSVRYLSLDDVQLDPDGLVSILAAIILSRSLRTLRLRKLDWNKKDIKRLLLASSHNRSIKNMILENMYLDGADAHVLASFMRRNKSVTELSLRQNALDADAVAVLVSDGLLKNKTLKKLLLSRNSLGDESAESIAQLLRECTTLEDICLVATNLTEQGCGVVAKALRYNKGLKAIRMDGNCVEGCAHLVRDSLQDNMRLHVVLERMPAVLDKQEAIDSDWHQVDLLLRANKANRCVLKDPNFRVEHMPLLLEGVGKQADVFFHLFTANAHYFS